MALAMFPLMVLGVGIGGIALTAVIDGRRGVLRLIAEIRVPTRRAWLLVLLVPPLAILLVLIGLEIAVSPDFAPQFLVPGVAAGLAAGVVEELGWSGFAYPRMRERFGRVRGALLLGIVWGVWHLPVVDALGAASPHGSAWPGFFAAFVTITVALRLLIARVYDATGSLLIAQLIHASSSGSLIAFGAARVTPGQEELWYFLYAGAVAVSWPLILVVCRWRRPAPEAVLGDTGAEGVKRPGPRRSSTRLRRAGAPNR